MAEHERGAEIRAYILKNVEEHPRMIARLTSAHFDIKERAVNLHVKQLVEQGLMVATGKTKSRTYALKLLDQWRKPYFLTPGLSEDAVWEDLRPKMENLPANVLDIWNGAVTEMFNNVLDHSEAKGAIVEFTRTAVNTQIIIFDQGVGIFKKIQLAKNLDDPRHAILELSKGKITTAPDHHSGIGIFFTSRMFDLFYIFSQGLIFTHQSDVVVDTLSQNESLLTGTMVSMKIANDSPRTTKEIYDRFADPEEDDFGFVRTIVPIKLAKYSGQLVSRSQAKMVLSGLDRFKIVTFDFDEVESIGQAFADEIFRVFANAHPEMQLRSVNTNERVNGMVQLALANAQETKAQDQKTTES
jgi:anti-sigma regulatory factor (Ser/Thr protein kinase)